MQLSKVGKGKRELGETLALAALTVMQMCDLLDLTYDMTGPIQFPIPSL